MTTLERTVTTAAPPEKVFPYLVDFRNATEWDSGTVSCDLVSGDGGPGTVYRNVSKFAGRETELEYELKELTDSRLVFVGNNKSATTTDTITVLPQGTGSEITYRADLELHGLASVAGPALKPVFEKLADDTEKQLTEVLDRRSRG